MNYLKKLSLGVSLIIAGLLSSTASHASAGQLDTAFGTIYASTNPAQEWKAAGRHGFVGSTGRIRFQQKNLDLINITPPSFSAGCNGISWNLGGLSFIDGEELVEFLQATGQAMVGQIILLAAKTICEPCTTTLETIQEWAQKAAMDGINSCNLAKSLVGKIENTGAMKDVKTAMGGFWSSADGEESDFQAGMKKLAEVPQKLNKTFQDFLKTDETREEENLSLTPNATWRALVKSGFIPQDAIDNMQTINTGWSIDKEERVAWAELVMSLIGTGDESAVAGAPTLGIETLFEYLRCGTEGSFDYDFDALTDWDKTCEAVWEKNKEVKILVCSNGDGTSNYETCYQEDDSSFYVDFEYLFNPTMNDSWLGHTLYSEPFSLIVAKSIDKALSNINSNKAPYHDNPYIMTILKIAPFDLYRVLNIASVAPETSHAIMMNSIEMISYSLVREYILTIMGAQGIGNKYLQGGGVEGMAISAQLRSFFKDFNEKFREKSEKNMVALMTEMDYQTSIMQKVQTIEAKVAVESTYRQIRSGKKWDENNLDRFRNPAN